MDYHEFMVGMTGNAKSVIDQSTEAEVDKLKSKFVEFAMKKKRENAIKAIEDADKHNKSRAALHGPKAGDVNTAFVSDYDKYKSFLTLFSLGTNTSLNEHYYQEDFEHEMKKAKFSETLLEDLIATSIIESKTRQVTPTSRNMSPTQKSLSPKASNLKKLIVATNPGDATYLAVEEKLKEERLKYIVSLQRDPEMSELHKRLMDERR